MSGVPCFWMYEASGVLVPVVWRYLRHEPMTDADIAMMRAYLRQWIAAPGWCGVDDLRQRIDTLTTRHAIDSWLEDALDAGIDPL
jgi:hypothetical protein